MDVIEQILETLDLKKSLLILFWGSTFLNYPINVESIFTFVFFQIFNSIFNEFDIRVFSCTLFSYFALLVKNQSNKQQCIVFFLTFSWAGRLEKFSSKFPLYEFLQLYHKIIEFIAFLVNFLYFITFYVSKLFVSILKIVSYITVTVFCFILFRKWEIYQILFLNLFF